MVSGLAKVVGFARPRISCAERPQFNLFPGTRYLPSPGRYRIAPSSAIAEIGRRLSPCFLLAHILRDILTALARLTHGEDELLGCAYLIIR